MPTFSVSQRALLVQLNNYLRGAPNLPVDSTVVEKLALIYDGTPGFRPSCGVRGTDFRTSMLTEPVRTFIKMLLSTSDGPTLVPCSGSGGGGDVPVPPVPPVVCPTVINLLTARTYGVLAGTPNINNTGNTVIAGDLGIHPAASVIGFPPGIVTGAQHIADATALQAKADLTAAYLVAEALPGGISAIGDIGGMTLTPGIYKSTSSMAVTTADVILDGGGDPCASFIFQAVSSLLFSTGRKVILINGANAARVFWQVGSSATINADAVVNGTILALSDITAVTGASVNGRLLARNGSVTLDTNVVVVPS